jgi:hypothetical protein
MIPADNINDLIEELHLKASADLDKRVHDDISKALVESNSTESVVIQPKIGRTIMKSPIVKLAAAAVIIIACVVGLSLWTTTGSGIALADVLARVEQVEAFRCNGSFEMTAQIAPGKPYKFETRSNFAMSQKYGYKLINETPDPNGGWLPLGEFYVSPQKKTFIQIAHTGKKYIRAGLDDAEAKQYRKQLGRYNDPGTLLKEIMACRYKNLGRSSIKGIDVEGFRTTDPNYCSPLRGSGFKDPQIDVKVWVGVKTRLPIQYVDLTSGIDQNGNKISQRFLLYDFEWDIPVMSSEFEPPPVPDGYAVLDNPPGLRNEETAIQGLKRCVDLLGNYLDTIDDGAGAVGTIFSAFEKSETPAALRLKEEIKGLTEQEKHSRVIDAGKPILRLIWFYVGLVQEKKDPAYYGKIVTPKDADKVLLRWKLSDNEYPVIYGDLHAETVTLEKLAELEKALPK